MQPEFNTLDWSNPLAGTTKTSLIFHGDHWTPTVSRAIDRRLTKRRSAIVELLDIDPKAVEYRRSPDLTEPGEMIALADLALEEISGELRRCWALLRAHGSELHGPPKPRWPITSDLRREPGALAAHAGIGAGGAG
ncbi:MAG: hypothetical protein IH904_00330 [Proteobacteria bacterium]|nr:hypothetical protein [Pseudomonadota bacterium]